MIHTLHTSLGLEPGDGLGILGNGVMGVVGLCPVVSDTNTRHALQNERYCIHAFTVKRVQLYDFILNFRI